MRSGWTAVVLAMLLAAIGALVWLCLHLPQPAAGVIAPPTPAIAPTPSPAAPPIQTVDPAFEPPSETVDQHTQPINALSSKPTPRNDPPAIEPPAVDPAKAVWKTVYEQHFDSKDSLKDFLQVDGGDLQWHEKYQALYLKNDPNGQIYAALHRSLPGDLRVRMRVLRTKQAREINLGLLFSINGALKVENGYFAEWKLGEVQIKRDDHYKTGGAASTPATENRWVAIELTKIGGEITMYLEGKQVARWTDPHPYRAANHDLLSLYVWDERTLIDDLIVERNANDPVEPMPDDPGAKTNAVDGMRGDNNPNPDQF